MEPDEIRAEIQRRKQLATDLKLRETLWSLYKSHLKGYAERLKRDPELIYPGIRESLEIAGTHIRFSVAETIYNFAYSEGPQEIEDWRSRGEKTIITPAMLGLEVDGRPVFDFKIQKSVRDTVDMPIFTESTGEITRFIEGPWVTNIAELLQAIKLHEKAVRDNRRAPILREEMERFGF